MATLSCGGGNTATNAQLEDTYVRVVGELALQECTSEYKPLYITVDSGANLIAQGNAWGDTCMFSFVLEKGKEYALAMLSTDRTRLVALSDPEGRVTFRPMKDAHVRVIPDVNRWLGNTARIEIQEQDSLLFVDAPDLVSPAWAILDKDQNNLPDYVDRFARNGAGRRETPTTCVPQDYGVLPDDDRDDSQGLNRMVQECDLIKLPRGVYVVENPIIINRSGVVFQGEEGTQLLSRIRGKGKAVLLVQGSKGKLLGRTTTPAQAGTGTVKLASVNTGTPPYIWLGKENTEDFLREIGSLRWFKDLPFVRQGIYRVKEVAKDKIILDESLDITYPLNTQVWMPELVQNVVIRDIEITQWTGGRPESVRFLYENAYPEYAVDSVRVSWSANVTIENLTIYMSGRHPLSVENSYGVKVINLKVNGAWNKGKGGNGYVRLSKSRKGLIENCYIKGIRHFVFQWSASENLLRNCYLEVDVNFHGGYTRFNRVEKVYIRVPKQHPWAPIEKTPQDAHWAPPDGPGNTVKNSVIEIGIY